ncbi:hypothetical protein ACFFYR_20920 [Paraburkholderia dipogonis]|uniref:hypothetical protein n=1 Tax=Paraburkholderia dipogonis TaxID=1211383 RepID=UPI001FCBBF37|nr:hypothetical protein [Paraburkholderia dipogonis]
MDAMQRVRVNAAAAVNAEDASVWRWFSALLEERRIRWRYMFDSWVVNVDRTRVATEPTFYDAIRAAKDEADRRGLGRSAERSRTHRMRSGASELEQQAQNEFHPY